jgi:hypothetical protein
MCKTKQRFDCCSTSATHAGMVGIYTAQVKCYISPFVLQEISEGDDNAAKKRTAITNSIPVLKVNPEIQQLSQRYFISMDIPEKARLDAFHLAIAVWHEIDYLLSWNCKHIVSGRVKKVLDNVNAKLHLKSPVLCTPEELMEV